MRRAFLVVTALATACVVAAPAAGAAAGGLTATPVDRLPFPERGYVVDLPGHTRLTADALDVTENGRPVRRLKVVSLSESGLRSGVVLAIDASESMTGAPLEAALAAAREFVSRRPGGQRIGLVVFNGDVEVLRAPSTDDADLLAALETPPALAYGTRIHDAVDRSLELLRRARLSTGAVVVLSDGADIGSVKELATVVSAAKRQHVRVFAVGLRSAAFDADALRLLAAETGGAYTEARTTAALASIFRALGQRFAREYLVQYRSAAPAESRVDVRIAVNGIGVVEADYVAPTPARAAPYHRPLLTRFLLSPVSVLAVALLVATAVGWAVVRLARGRKNSVVDRIVEFADGARAVAVTPAARTPARHRRYAHGWWANLERDLEIARIDRSPRAVVASAGTATVAVFALLLIVSQLVAVLSLLTPLVARGIVRRKLRAVREEFADQLPANLQVLASALRAGHSLTGALGVVVENAHEPARSELQRILQDDQFGVPLDESIRRIATRMENRDLEQVALLAELQRTSGGNAAEVLDTVVSTIRERGELRRMIRTLTAQGRMARWILSALPIVVAGFLFVMRPEVMAVLFHTSGGQFALVVAGLLVVAGSLVIQRIVEIDV